jgi:hypothetical protein
MAKLDFKTNIPVVGTVKYLDYYPEREVKGRDGKTFMASAQVRLKGTFDGTDGEIYLPAFLAEHMIRDGLAQDAGERDGKQQFKWLEAGPVEILRAENGAKKITTVRALNGKATDAAPTATGAVSPPPAASPSKGTAIPVSATAAPSAVPHTQDDGWDALARQYTRAVDVAGQAWKTMAASTVDWSAEAMVAAAATVFIEANKRGLTVPAPHAPKTAEQRAAAVRDAIDRYAKPPAALGDPGPQEAPPDDELPF